MEQTILNSVDDICNIIVIYEDSFSYSEHDDYESRPINQHFKYTSNKIFTSKKQLAQWVLESEQKFRKYQAFVISPVSLKSEVSVSLKIA